ncbi:MAG: hypothetical protein CTY12_07305 [Methylotenera sp.]|nr:MAG: hypothetical protein CTY12_07305 [Methylotenera sp.]
MLGYASLTQPTRAEKSLDGHPSFIDRVLTAIIAPIAFNVSIFIFLVLLLGSSGSRILIRSQVIYKTPISLIFILSVLLPALLGFMMGLSRFTTLFGHFFYTNMGDEKDIFKTIAAWICLFLIAYIITGVLE